MAFCQAGDTARVIFPDGSIRDFANTPIDLEETNEGIYCETRLSFEIDGEFIQSGALFDGIHYGGSGFERIPYGGWRLKGTRLEVFTCFNGRSRWSEPLRVTRDYQKVRSVRPLTNSLNVKIWDSESELVHDQTYTKPTSMAWADFRSTVECLEGCPPNTLDCGDCCLDCRSVFNQLSGLRAQIAGIK